VNSILDDINNLRLSHAIAYAGSWKTIGRGRNGWVRRHMGPEGNAAIQCGRLQSVINAYRMDKTYGPPSNILITTVSGS
jgi:hypothetical protein